MSSYRGVHLGIISRQAGSFMAIREDGYMKVPFQGMHRIFGHSFCH